MSKTIEKTSSPSVCSRNKGKFVDVVAKLKVCYEGYEKYGLNFEKYIATEVGSSGSGGEYTEQTGFGWTNGVVLSFLETYGSDMTYSGSNLEALSFSLVTILCFIKFIGIFE